MNKKYLSTIVILLASGCGTTSLHQNLENHRRQWLDSSLRKDDPPEWVTSTKIIYEKDNRVYFRTSRTVRGDERVDGCFDLARLDCKETLLSELANDVKGVLDSAQQSLNESAEIVLGKVRSDEYQGRIIGLRFTEQYYERYRINGIERLDCHILAEMKSEDYLSMKRSIVDKVVAADPRIKEAIARKQIDFFAPKNDEKNQ